MTQTQIPAIGGHGCGAHESHHVGCGSPLLSSIPDHLWSTSHSKASEHYGTHGHEDGGGWSNKASIHGGAGFPGVHLCVARGNTVMQRGETPKNEHWLLCAPDVCAAAQRVHGEPLDLLKWSTSLELTRALGGDELLIAGSRGFQVPLAIVLLVAILCCSSSGLEEQS
ncbi:hypothetical protein H920_20077 [Fukomys damarensis]|uniref:Uncharacterized protein n=1 Tax=Fukomys damarensis TaxID=885580 RepID=A0A091CJ44_FUKDA|nr:hypothetical protein H920_20077 [Fukomys damarensis]